MIIPGYELKFYELNCPQYLLTRKPYGEEFRTIGSAYRQTVYLPICPYTKIYLVLADEYENKKDKDSDISLIVYICILITLCLWGIIYAYT